MANTSFSSENNMLNEHNNIEDHPHEADDQYFVATSQLILLGTIPMVLKAAVELDIFVIIAKAGPGSRLSPKEIAAQMPACQNHEAPAMLDRMLRLLATHSVVSCSVEFADDGSVERRYSLGPISKLFVPDDNGICLGPFMCVIEDPIFRGSWSKFNEAVLEGGSAFNRVYGVHAFEYPKLDPRFNQVFNAAMFNYTTMFTNKMLKKYKGFEGIKQLVDVGGGLGHTLHAITSLYPSIKGINFDLPHVISDAQLYPGVEHVGGDMFESVPKGDSIFMKWILHDWSDDRCLTLLKNCYKALPEDGKVIVVESILTEEPGNTMVAKAVSEIDVFMMANNPGGKERTEKQFLALANAAGFAGVELVCRVSLIWVMEFHK